MKDSFDSTWTFIQSKGFQRIRDGFLNSESGQSVSFKRQTVTEWHEMHRAIYDLCATELGVGYSRELYSAVQKEYSEFACSLIVDENEINQLIGGPLLDAFLSRWNKFACLIEWTQRMFSYVERHYIKQSEKSDFREMGENCFKNKIFQPFSARICKTIIGEVRAPPSGTWFEENVIQKAVSVVTVLSDIEWKNAFYKEAERHIQTECRRLNTERLPLTEYVEHACNLIQREFLLLKNNVQNGDRARLQTILSAHLFTALFEESLCDTDGLPFLLRMAGMEAIEKIIYQYKMTGQPLDSVIYIVRTQIEEEIEELMEYEEAQSDASVAIENVYVRAREMLDFEKKGAMKPLKGNVKKGVFMESFFFSKLARIFGRYQKISDHCFQENDELLQIVPCFFKELLEKNVSGESIANSMERFCKRRNKDGNKTAVLSDERLDNVVLHCGEILDLGVQKIVVD